MKPAFSIVADNDSGWGEINTFTIMKVIIGTEENKRQIEVSIDVKDEVFDKIETMSFIHKDFSDIREIKWAVIEEVCE